MGMFPKIVKLIWIVFFDCTYKGIETFKTAYNADKYISLDQLKSGDLSST